jgi:membrane protease YdiL (CAAX protease family)
MILLITGYVLLLMSADRRQQRLLAAIGVGRFPGWLRQALLGVVLGATFIVVAVVCMGIFGDLKVTITISAKTIIIAFIELLILGAAAMTEELMFRSYPFYRLVEAAQPLANMVRLQATGPLVAVIVMSLLFGFAHGGNPHASPLALVNTCLIGGLLCVAVLRTGSLWMAWGIHFAWNTVLGLVFGLPVSGLNDFAVMVKTRAVGARWMTGGSYGIEGSWLGTIVIALGFIPVILLTRGGFVNHEPFEDGSVRGAATEDARGIAQPGLLQDRGNTANDRQPAIGENSASDQPQEGRIQEY